MPKITVGTSLDYYPLATQRRIVKSSNGTLLLFADTGNTISTRLQYNTSSDNGDTWNGWNNIYQINNISGVDIYIDTNDDIYAVFWTSSNGTLFIKLTYSGGTWTVGSPVVITSDSLLYNGRITKRSNGDLFVCVQTASKVYGFYSSDLGSTWNTASSFTPSGTLNGISIIPKDSNIWCFTNAGAAVKVYEYTTDWDGGTTIDTVFLNESPGAIRISDSDIWAVGRTASGLKVFHYTGTWDSGSYITTSSSDRFPMISKIVNKPVIVYLKRTTSPYQIYYIAYDGSNWGSETLIDSDTIVKGGSNSILSDNGTFYVSWQEGSAPPITIYFDKVLFATPPVQKTIISDVHFKGTEQKTITSDVRFVDEGVRTITSDVHFILAREQKNIISDVHFKAIIQETILSDVKFVIEGLYNINNKISFVKQVLSNINNKVNSVKRVFKDINNFINTCKSVISDITNDFRTKKQPLYNINNDIRFIKSWQKSGDYGFQSLGKSYIRVYFGIGEIEQTDIDVDSIKIFKTVNGIKTASFDLGRVYDGTLPTMETLVQIKYNDWVLYRGYITSIAPASDPESITVNCQDEFWKQNKTNKYFFVGHKPTDDKELYYSTIQEAISTEFSWNLSIGNFVPEVISCFGEGQSDILSNLIQQTGNHGFFYDETGTKKLWKAGSGSIIDIQRQTIGSNIGLYQLINHKYNKNVDGLVNKLRVQMGDKVIRKFNTTGGSRTYTGYNYASYKQYVTPAWDETYEVLAKYSGTGEGWDKHSTENDDLYRDVFKKYTMPYLNPELSSWSDRYPPYVEIYEQYWTLFNAPIAVLKDGFTIDYENKTITFNDPIFLYKTDANGECIAIRAPVVRVFLWKKDYYTYTLDPSDDPETDISNPLMFFTDKIGTYPDTIIKELNLSQLSIQVGGLYQNLDGTTELIPSWDDTDFAEDFAYWQLSKTAYEKIIIDIELTLDTVCFYNLSLDKRINIDGITDGAMNIISINYDMSNFTVSIQLEKLYPYTRTISLQSRGE